MPGNARPRPWPPVFRGPGRRGAEEGALRAQPQQRQPPSEIIRQSPGSFEDWLRTSVRQATHEYKAATMTLVREQRIDTCRVALCWYALEWLMMRAHFLCCGWNVVDLF